jgi:hypothetical protein
MEGNKTETLQDNDLTLPFDSQKMKTLMNGKPLLYNISTLSKDYYRFFEVGVGFFLRNGSKSAFVNNYDYKTFSKYFGGRNDITSSGTHDGVKLQGTT